MKPDQNVYFLLQGLELFHRLDPEVYSVSVDARASVGAHLRHVIDYYHCFFRGVGDGRINYDERRREAALESDPRLGAAALQEIIERFGDLEDDSERPIEVKVDTDDAEDARSRSTLGRELQFLVSHTVHHYALIALLLRRQGVEPGESFGVAPSTLEYRKAQAEARDREDRLCAQ